MGDVKGRELSKMRESLMKLGVKPARVRGPGDCDVSQQANDLTLMSDRTPAA